MKVIQLNWPWRWWRHGIVKVWREPDLVPVASQLTPFIAPPEFGIIDPDVQRIHAEEMALLQQNVNLQSWALQQALLQQQAFGVGIASYNGFNISSYPGFGIGAMFPPQRML